MTQPRANASCVALLLSAFTLGGTVSCGPVALTDFFDHITAPLGSGTIPLLGPTDTTGRDPVNMVVNNNTRFFVSAFFGAFDQLNDDLAPSYGQFLSDSETPNLTLGPFETSEAVAMVCGRTVSLGDPMLLDAIRRRDPDAPLDELRDGITFSTRLLDDPDAQVFTINNVPNQRVNLGVDYQCNALIFYELNPDETAPSGIRIDVSVLLP